MSDRRYLHQRRQTWYVAVEMPPSLRHLAGTKRIKRSLRTRDLEEARLRRWSVVAEIKRRIEDFRKVAERSPSDRTGALAEARILLRQGPVVNLLDPTDQDFHAHYLEEKAEALERRHGFETAKAFHDIASGSRQPLSDLVEPWLADSDMTDQTRGLYRTSLREFFEWSGGETSVRVAVSMGLIRPAPGGGYEDVTTEAATAQPRDEQQPAPAAREENAVSPVLAEYGAAEELPDDASRVALQEITSALTTDYVYEAINEVVEKGELSERTVGRVATALNITTEEAIAKLAALNSGFEAQRNQVLAAEGIEEEVAQMFWQWAAEDKAEKAAQALKQQFANGNLQGFRELAREFYVSYLPYADPQVIIEAAKASGMEAFHNPHLDRVILNVPGHGQMEYTAALRAGIIGQPRYE